MIKAPQIFLWHQAQGLPKDIFAGQTLAIIDSEQTQQQPYLQFNLGLHVGDSASQVQKRRIALLKALQPYGVTRLQWLNQTHSTTAYLVDDQIEATLLDGDGLVTQQKGVALMMMTADCLPIVVSNAQGTEIACLHAGWRGLANGIIEATLAKMQTQPVYAWIGAAISQANFEVGAEVKAAFVSQNSDFENDFIARQNGKYLADLYAIATKKLQALGITSVTGGDRCSYAETDSFYSYRRQAKTGRMATFIFISAQDDRLA
ncbi:peptidoglycan editing factor PgeF [Acinetobacter qingfengensis]|uniref:Purine nucleoside phosphorylase n=1 Tax=Acinetobacter qingfengensis TaxID=1262585 RepID=A0A1E7RFG9_9GAMM|nr:peptidoglycan editing factor PgeF [Acinetobacter qingfengensis]KAA8732818.1 peptidoglycan editing factor PgeF [Acinetobacter qingfengensis]OEY98071.1 hypothetical protein BJI46_00665 [Acinetobacter qingfengensis]